MASRKRKFKKTFQSDESENDEDQLFPYLFVDVSSEDDGDENEDFQLGEGVTTRRQAAKEKEEKENQVRSESPPPKKEKKDLKQKKKTSKLSNAAEVSSTVVSAQAQSRTSSPVAGPSGLQAPVVTAPRAPSPVAGPSGLQAAVSTPPSPSNSPIPESSRLVDTDLFEQETPVFENSDFTMYIQKAEHQRQKVLIISLLLNITCMHIY